MNRMANWTTSGLLSLSKIWRTAVFVVFFPSGAFAQTLFTSDEPFQPKKTGNLFIAADNLNFFKNNEYKSGYAEGYTLTGTWIRPKLLYYPDKKFRLEIGGQVLAYTGRDEYLLHPWFSAQYKPLKGLSFRMGNLDQDNNHGLPQPMMDTEHFLVDKPEAGLQVKFKNRHFKADLWIDWQKMILEGDPFKEQFVFGTTASIWLINNGTLELSLPLAFNGLHRGGEIDSADGLATTCLTFSEGFKIQNKFQSKNFTSWYLESNLFQSAYPEDLTGLQSDFGTAWHFTTGITTSYGNVSTGFWQGSNFYNPLGMPLFQNSAEGRTEAVSLNRLWTLSYHYDRKIFRMSSFGFKWDLFHNTLQQTTSNCAALYLMINLSFPDKKRGS